MSSKKQRQALVDDVESIMNLEGLTEELAPLWFRQITQDYIDGKITHDEAKKRLIEHVAAGGLNG